MRNALRPFDTLRVAPSVVEGREPPLDTLPVESHWVERGAVSTVEPQGPEHGRRADFGLRIERQKAKTRDGGPRGFAGRGGGKEEKLAETGATEWCWKSRGPLFKRKVP